MGYLLNRLGGEDMEWWDELAEEIRQEWWDQLDAEEAEELQASHTETQGREEASH